jgi:hypothetical protein
VAHERRDLSSPYQHAALFYAQLTRDRRIAKVIAKSDEFRDHVEAALERSAQESPALVLALTVALAQASALVGNLEPADRLSRQAVESFTQEGAVVGDEPPCIFLTRAHVLDAMGASQEELAGAMQRVCTDARLAATLGARGARRALIFDWTASAHTLRELYEALTAARGRRSGA